MRRALVLLLVVVVTVDVCGQGKPFVQGSSAAAEPTVPSLAGGRFLAWLSDVQRGPNGRLVALSRQAKEEPTAAPVLLAFLTAFLFGMVHAAGPGHGKTFTLSYFLAENPRVGRGILFGGLISILDSV